MKKKFLGVLVSLIVISMFTVPAFAKPTETEITYTKKRVGPMALEWMMAGKSHIFHVVKSEQSGFIYVGDEAVGDPVFEYTAIGKMHTNSKSGIQPWHFDYVWTSIAKPDSGFEGRLNGLAIGNSMFIVSGILHGFGDFEGEKLVVEAERQSPRTSGIAIFTGVHTTP